MSLLEECFASVPAYSSSPPVPASTDEHRTRVFRDFASRLIIRTHTFFARVTHLPFPIGPIMEVVEDTVDPWTHPYVEALETRSLDIGTAVEDQIYAVRTFVERCINDTSAKLKSVPPFLRRRGFIGVSVDLWMKYEGSLKDKMQRAVDFAQEVPGLKLITPIICAVSVPLARAISDYCVEHTDGEEKNIQTSDYCVEHTDGEEKNIQTSEPEEKNIQTSERQDAIATLPSSVKHSEPEEEDSQTSEGQGATVTQNAEAETKQIKEGEKVTELDISHKQGDLTDIFEMLDSGWLMGAGNVSRKNSVNACRSHFSSRSSSTRF